MQSPSFRYMGGKSRLRGWLLQYFPASGNLYMEPFAGRGNVFFEARKRLKFKKWWLNDLDSSFLVALSKADLDSLPQDVNKRDFDAWKHKNDDIAKILEPRITFGGKGYKAGYSGTSGTHKGYCKDLYGKTCQSAKELLIDVKVTQLSWEQLGITKLRNNDFIYCDPPYIDTKAPYPNIKHEYLVKTLNASSCKWALSGYSNDLYDSKLIYKNCYTKERNAEIKGSNTGQREPVIEVLWTNY